MPKLVAKILRRNGRNKLNENHFYSGTQTAFYGLIYFSQRKQLKKNSLTLKWPLPRDARGRAFSKNSPYPQLPLTGGVDLATPIQTRKNKCG